MSNFYEIAMALELMTLASVALFLLAIFIIFISCTQLMPGHYQKP